MHDILQDIIARKRYDVAIAKTNAPTAALKERVAELEAHTKRSMRAALEQSDSGIIAEFKRRSPSKDWINQAARPDIVPPAYAAAGAAALSILTDEPYFGGHLSFIETARPLVPATPILRKDFIVDPYQLYEARLVNADAVLLIAAALTTSECAALADEAHALGLEMLLEVHSEDELAHVAAAQPDMVGVNNRCLGTFVTDVETSFRLAEKLPTNVVRVSESGLSQPATVRRLRAAGYRGFLMGEHFMRAAHQGEALSQFIQEVVSPTL